MLSKRANPDGRRAFDFRQGQFFRFHKSQEEADLGTITPAVQQFWFCDAGRVCYFPESRESADVVILARLGDRIHNANRAVAAA